MLKRRIIISLTFLRAFYFEQKFKADYDIQRNLLILNIDELVLIDISKNLAANLLKQLSIFQKIVLFLLPLGVSVHLKTRLYTLNLVLIR